MAERKRIYLCLAHMSEAGLEQKYIKEAFDTNWVVPLGPNVNAFEQELERFACSQNVKMKECNNVKVLAFMFSAIESCDINRLSPEAYLRKLILGLHNKTVEKKQLLPCYIGL